MQGKQRQPGVYLAYREELRAVFSEGEWGRPPFRRVDLACRSREDVDPSAVDTDSLVAHRWEAIGLTFLLGPSVVEVTEPLWLRAWPTSFAVVLAARAGCFLRGSAQPLAISYGIENLDRTNTLSRWALRTSSRVLDQLLVGTSAAERLYTSLGFPNVLCEDRTCACDACFEQETREVPCERSVVFLAEFSERKGVDLLVEAWPVVAEEEWRLTLIGFGPLEAPLHAWAATRDDVTVLVNPPRSAIHRRLAEAAVVALPSRRIPGWREQVGISILEGLAHGCGIATTSETGLADSLAAEGHSIAEPDSVQSLIKALGAQMAKYTGAKHLPDPDQLTRSELERLAFAIGSERQQTHVSRVPAKFSRALSLVERLFSMLSQRMEKRIRSRSTCS